LFFGDAFRSLNLFLLNSAAFVIMLVSFTDHLA